MTWSDGGLQMLLERFPEPEGRPALRILTLTDGVDTKRCARMHKGWLVGAWYWID